MLINNVCTFTGMSEKVSKNTGNKYYLYSFLNPDGDGSVFSVYSEKLFKVSPLNSYNVIFNLKLGRFIGLELADLETIE